jgi:hypothetical protein
MPELDSTVTPARWRSAAWPWLVIALTILPAIWHVVVFPNDLDPEFPQVERPTFNRMPPPAYRLAEPGDTLDRVAIYMASAGLAIGLIGLARSQGQLGLWPASIALALAGLWHASTPGPTFDGWHGLGWRVIFDPGTPGDQRLAVGLAAASLATVVLMNLIAGRRGLWHRAGELRIRGLLIASAVLIGLRQFEIPGVEPVGYWPRWAFIWGLLAFDLAILRALVAKGVLSWWARLGTSAAGVGCWCIAVVLGVWISWFHRPLERLREVDRDKLYISAMPTYAGLKVAHERHHFKTIINIFPEDTSQRSQILPDEHRFVREHGIRYIEASAHDNDSDEFLDFCLNVAQDPESWPILLHCHGSMDRSPGWMGLYRFIVQGRPLDAILKEIEVHRGYRPKSSITLLFNRVLEPRAPERYRDDPTAKLLVECAHGVALPPSRVHHHPFLSRSGEPPKRP